MDARLNSQFKAAVDAKLVPAAGGVILSKSGDVLWKGAFGTTNLSDASATMFTEHTPSIIYSMTKLVTTVAALQLIEQGKLSLDDPVQKYAREFEKIQFLDGFSEDGTPKLRAPSTKATVRHLLTHTTGLTYDFFDPATLRWRVTVGQPPAPYNQCQILHYQSPLISEPGAKYVYGISTDWLGFVVEGVTGTSLPEYVDKHILKPLKMTDSAFQLPPDASRLNLHARVGDQLISMPEVPEGVKLEFFSGGAGLYSSIHDYSQFLLALLNGGEHPTLKVRILNAETVQSSLFADHMSQMQPPPDTSDIGVIKSSIPQMTAEGELLPGIEKTWSLGLMINKQACPKGRSAGSASWAGLANTCFLLDPTAGKLLVFITSVLPFFDAQALHLWDEMERAAYGHEAKKRLGEEGGNHVCWPSPPTAATTA